jgi:hypothetical protein
LADIDATLEERGTRYGSFKEHAKISQSIVRAMADSSNWSRLDDDMREAFHIIANKMGRILNGDPWYHDSWHDIVGYAKLVADRLEQEAGGTGQNDRHRGDG